MNSPLIRRKKKATNGGSNGDEKIPSKVKEKLEGHIKGEKKKNLKTAPNKPTYQDEDHYSFNLLLDDDDDSESDDDMGEPKDQRFLATSHAAKDREGAYHNLETFQKKQLKQKV